MAKRAKTTEEDEGGAIVSFWLKKIDREEKAHADFRKEGDEAEEDYFDESKTRPKNLFPMFWSNVNTMHSALYSATPVPDVRARNSNANDPAHEFKKEASLAIERSLVFTVDTTDFDGAANRAVDDFLIAGAGVPWVNYEAMTSEVEGPPGADGKPTLIPQIDLQKVSLTRKPWRRFRWEPGVEWEDCDWIAVDHYLSASEIKKQFGQDVPQGGTGSSEKVKPDKTTTDKYASQYLVHEIWHKPNRTKYVIGRDFDKPLEVAEDKLGLEGFFPCPKPLFANLKSREFTPKGDYAWYKEQCDYINILSARIKRLTENIRDVGFYDAQLKELADLNGQPDGTLVPISSLAERIMAASGKGWEAVIAKLPNADKVEVLKVLIEMRETAKQVVYEITGISDIVRGATSASETATAQEIKGQWAGVRLRRRQQEVQRAFRDCFRIMAEIIAEHFEPQQIYLMTGMQLSPQALQLLKTDVGRTFAIDVETDSTIAADEQAERQDVTTLLQTLTEYTNGVLPQVQAGTMPADLAKEMLLMVVGAFKSGRSLEEQVEKLPSTVQQIGQIQQQSQSFQQQLAQCQEQLAACQKQLQQHSAVDDQNETVKTGADAQLKGAQTQLTLVKAQKEAATPIQLQQPPRAP